MLDVGCGAGVDTIMAGIMVGPEGKASGIDTVPEMIARAEKNLCEVPLKNVFFRNGSAEALPFPDARFEVVISNGVFNLIPDKRKAIKEVLRVLKPNGRFMIADQVLVGRLEKDRKKRVNNWFK